MQKMVQLKTVKERRKKKRISNTIYIPLHRQKFDQHTKQTSLFTLDISFITSLPGDNLRNSWQLLPPAVASREVPSVLSAWPGAGTGSGVKCFSFVSLSLSVLGLFSGSSTEHVQQVSICIFRLLLDGVSSSGALVTDCSIWETNKKKGITRITASSAGPSCAPPYPHLQCMLYFYSSAKDPSRTI